MIEHELKDNILDYWLTHVMDWEQGGFHGEIDDNNAVHAEADRSLVLNTRLIWTFATAYRFYRDEKYLRAANHVYSYLVERFLDRECGGYGWMVTYNGELADAKKQVYGQAFVIYALSELYRATGNERALEQAIALFRLVEKHAFDPDHGGYLEAFAEDWKLLDDYSLSDSSIRADKTMNTHLHMLEAYTGLYRVWPDSELKAKLEELVTLTSERIVNSQTNHFHLYFDRCWNSLSSHISYGHDIEGSWLLAEAVTVLGDEALRSQSMDTVLKMAEAVLEQGMDADGGLWNESDGTILSDRLKDWWPQAEAMVGFFNGYQHSGQSRYLAAAYRSWTFIDTYLVDRDGGEWHQSIGEDHAPSPGPKVSAWKCPYHNGRACFEMIERLAERAENVNENDDAR
ncbi:N-acyl-D-glucosamine 2-epimerase [Paenibacillus rhizovicinus]|uniref:Cellobiose 2-epimerase n=2 Tax=Paenibacillus rhizovicinus TaxID=2704463 RepID=A0A6C0P8H8_9BACL|nr:N-acyl-D-glucosamine 2-epimerase [Paenibacillus rhizovicinus]